MADFRIEKVIINPNQTWIDITQHLNWQALRNPELSWGHTNQLVEVNQPIMIEFEIIISSWARIQEGFRSWQTIKDTITTWSTLKTW